MHYERKADQQELWAMFCKETSGPGIYRGVILIHTIFLNTVAEQVHSFMALEFTNENDPATLQQPSGMVWQNQEFEAPGYLLRTALVNSLYKIGPFEYINLGFCQA